MTVTVPQLTAPIPIAEIRSANDRFRCPPYGVVMFADSCVKRQAVMRADPARSGFGQCLGCEHGALVESNVGGPVSVTVEPQHRRWIASHYVGRPAAPKAPSMVELLLDEPTIETPPMSLSEKTVVVAPAVEAVTPTQLGGGRLQTCRFAGCHTLVRPGKFKGTTTPEQVGLCAVHRVKVDGPAREAKLNYQAAWREKRKLDQQHATATDAHALRLGLRRLAPSAPTPPTASPVADVRNVADELVEAHRLVGIIGWDLVRGLAARVERVQ